MVVRLTGRVVISDTKSIVNKTIVRLSDDSRFTWFILYWTMAYAPIMPRKKNEPSHVSKQAVTKTPAVLHRARFACLHQ